jgi:DNA-binding NarL/FixJ family response regulator
MTVGANTRVLVADDHDMIRAGLCSILGTRPGLQVVAEAEDGEQAVRLASELSPDLVIMDITMPRLNGIDATRQIIAADSSVKVIALSMHSDRQFVVESLKAGVSAYLLKNTAGRELLTAVTEVLAGKMYLSPSVADAVVHHMVNAHEPRPQQAGFGLLTAREREVLQHLAEGKTNKEAAAALFISAKTVETHRAQIMDKLGIHTVAGLTKFAIRHGLTSLT